MSKPKKRSSRIGHLLGVQVREHRLAQNLTQSQLAERVGVETETISRLERGSALPSLLKIEELAAALGASVAALVGGSSTLASDQARQMESLLEGLDESGRSFILDIARRQREFLLGRRQ
ncbi:MULTISPECIES: helix-turn-helix transcriptional regulator [unclassified Pseudomonas]|uniref:helix-turn-helix transcriptional regulator n=1 Tax=unclassified Pseudomonas TaxID=196821 RepID=UPI002446845F|nr:MULTISPECIES: helix-turn-helix transcriptional regulator [unclassified Pseudomonas]MDH0893948.1 helix-turn-helix domain-containing protein [Pseudomonas sp. GD03875]MDH1065329.1 helix-turn-helix domain-containing protein [Pseudomonas sp. GD03985]